jgi:hypothetical protein
MAATVQRRMQKGLHVYCNGYESVDTNKTMYTYSCTMKQKKSLHENLAIARLVASVGRLCSVILSMRGAGSKLRGNKFAWTPDSSKLSQKQDQNVTYESVTMLHIGYADNLVVRMSRILLSVGSFLIPSRTQVKCSQLFCRVTDSRVLVLFLLPYVSRIVFPSFKAGQCTKQKETHSPQCRPSQRS